MGNGKKNSSAPSGYGGGQPDGKPHNFFDEYMKDVGNFSNGMMGKTPDAPDYKGAAEQTAAGNRLNTTNAFGAGQTFNPDGSVSQSFGAGMQPTVNRLQNLLAQQWGQPLDNGSAARDQAINAMYGQARSRLDPQWDQRSQQMQSQLANQGLDPNSQAYRTAMDSMSRDRNDAYTSAMNGAIGMGNQAQDLTFNQNMATRNAPLMALGQFQNFLGQPGYQPGPDYLRAAQLAGGYGMDQAQLQTQATNDIVQGGVGLAGAMGSAAGGAAGSMGKASDARVKKNINRLPIDAAPGVPLATFEYKNKPGKHVGVIAQDLEKTHPEHVQEDEHGIKHVSRHFAPFRFK